MKREDIAARVKEFPWDRGEYWVITGAAMVLYGIREETHDIDMGCTKALADRLEEEGHLHRITPDGNRWFKLGDDVEVFENWLYDDVVRIDGIPVVSVPGLLEMKRRLGREKDLRDIARIESFLKNAGHTL
ncbi:MAG: hypothetical protein IJH47_10810 [Oscillospiraceae bacterium]|nr:hypothetical protein [Oscillospiraceae bacterium]